MKENIEITDYEIIELINQGDSSNFEILVERYKDKSLNLAISILPQLSEAENALQDAFIKVFHKSATFNKKSTFKTWFYRIVINTCYDYKRKRKIKTTTLDSNYTSYFFQADTQITTEEKITRVHSALEKMKPEHSIILKMFYLSNLKIKEISKILNITESKVKVTLHRSRKTFKDIYESNTHNTKS